MTLLPVDAQAARPAPLYQSTTARSAECVRAIKLIVTSLNGLYGRQHGEEVRHRLQRQVLVVSRLIPSRLASIQDSAVLQRATYLTTHCVYARAMHLRHRTSIRCMSNLQPALAGLSLLDTPSYVILLVFVCFLVLSGIFEHVRLQPLRTLFACCFARAALQRDWKGATMRVLQWS